jgi:hypothetical protein
VGVLTKAIDSEDSRLKPKSDYPKVTGSLNAIRY